ncbi:hypothetical protein DPMN_061210 [Dreissena polymorpha]|uniref:Uncharacterized protein n=1 Tax=Dreissena polymorpha TaxID=45954 RepID=A0A9D4C6K4_DREPO|nr:hypothetical protein DPMN_061210 [Dreissena polymorpha]
MESLQASYNKQLHKIHDTRQKINTILDEIEKNTVKELDDKMTILKASIKTDVDNCSKVNNELNRLSDAMHDILDKGKVELLFIASKKCLEKVKQSETYLKENSVKVESSLSFKANSDVQRYLSKLSGLGRIVLSSQPLSVKGNPDLVFTVQGKSEYDMRILSDYWKFMKSFFSIGHSITAICDLPNDQILVADHSYERIKLLNHQYQVVGYCDLTGYPRNICHITANKVAISMNKYKTYAVQFVSVNSGRLVMGINLQFQHLCNGIAHNLQNLYITSDTALFKYSMS